ncbi:recombinase family protein [Clostridium sp. WILCCON 0269]|uniref:Recombinase family protein n=1 Tax=Candidatus Clostridium eludens TaxID=3381663 RepID=A0ABW8SJR1_9CLOT
MLFLYQLLKSVADKGDVIYIKSLDRLGRNKRQIKEELEYFRNKGVRIKILDLPHGHQVRYENNELNQLV